MTILQAPNRSITDSKESVALRKFTTDLNNSINPALETAQRAYHVSYPS